MTISDFLRARLDKIENILHGLLGTMSDDEIRKRCKYIVNGEKEVYLFDGKPLLTIYPEYDLNNLSITAKFEVNENAIQKN